MTILVFLFMFIAAIVLVCVLIERLERADTRHVGERVHAALDDWSRANREMSDKLAALLVSVQADQRLLIDAVISLSSNPAAPINAARLAHERNRDQRDPFDHEVPATLGAFIEQQRRVSGAARRDGEAVPVGLTG